LYKAEVGKMVNDEIERLSHGLTLVLPWRLPIETEKEQYKPPRIAGV
jgi:hypothetical protein